MKWPWSRSRSAGGFDQNVLRDINSLKEILQRYEGRAWLKEVIQNADDAGATQLDLGWVSRLPGTSHPLLRGGPAVFVLNDGPFTARNAVAIHQLGLSDKASDRSSIGRFGLGLKSLFHWCEAYFYLSSGHPTFAEARVAEDYLPNALFNPWNGPSRIPFHDDWNDFEEADKRRIREYLGGLNLLPARDWFCLWIPLRRRDTCGGVQPISELYPGEDGEGWAGIIPQDLPIDLAILPPLLQELRTIRGWADESGTAALTHLFELQLEDGSTRRRYKPDRDDDRPLRESWSGKITTRSFGAGRDLTHDYTGVERLLTDDQTFHTLRNADGWPKSFGPADYSTGQSRQEPTHATPHVAAVLTRRKCDQGKCGCLILRWAAYLPVGEEPAEVVDLGGDSDLTLVLHGDFFVDAGRKNVDFPSEPGTVPQEWNARLRDYGSLPLVLYALEQLALSAGASTESLQRITSALAKTTLFRKHREQICERRRWLFRIEKSIGRWTLVDANDEIYEIPSPPDKAPGLHLEVVSGLIKAVDDRRHVTFLNHPRLESATARISDWPEDLLLTLLDLPAAEVFAHDDRLSYLVNLLELALNGRALSPQLEDRLCGLAYAAFDLVGTRRLASVGQVFSRFLALIPPARRIDLDVAGIEGATVELLFRMIAGCHLHCVLVPSGFEPRRHDVRVLQRNDKQTGFNPEPEDAEKVLNVLARLSAESILPNRRSDLACQVLEALGENSRHLDGKCDELYLFLGRANADSDEQLLSRRELAQARERGLLFTGELGHARQLQAALRGRDVAVADAHAVKLLFGHQHVRSCDAQACLANAREPRLTESEAPRISLLAVICTGLAQRPIGADRQSLRYLIHGRLERLENEATLFAGAVPGLSPVWLKLVRRALRVADGGWRNVDPEVIRHVTRDQEEALGVRQYDLKSVLQLLYDVGPDRIDVEDLSDDDRGAILREARAEHAEVVRGLRIHRTRRPHRRAVFNRRPDATWQFRRTRRLAGRDCAVATLR